MLRVGVVNREQWRDHMEIVDWTPEGYVARPKDGQMSFGDELDRGASSTPEKRGAA